MEIILKQNVPNLGYKDDIVTVTDGYGRNYLIPQGMAIVATNAAKKILAENKKRRNRTARTNRGSYHCHWHKSQLEW